MLKKFEFEFEDISSKGSIKFEYDDDLGEKMCVRVENGVPVVYANRTAFLFLARTFAKIALGEYRPGFHIHLYQDLDADQPEGIRFILDDWSSSQSGQ